MAAALAGFISSLFLALLALLDFRRGFVFAGYPVRTLFFVLTPAHGLMLVVAIGGMAASHHALRRLERSVSDRAVHVGALTAAILVLLVADLFGYRGVPAARSIASGRINADWLAAFGVTAWWRPIAQATSYLLNVWHATLLGIGRSSGSAWSRCCRSR